MTPQDFHAVGKRDAVAEIFTHIRLKGEREALLLIAKQLLAVDPTHPHAKWYVEEHPPAQ